MKKNLIYALALASSMMAACTDDYTDWAAPQQADPEPAFSVSLAVAPVAAIDLATVTTESVQVFTPTLTTDAEGAETSYTVVLDAAHELAADAEGQVIVSDLAAAVTDIFGMRPTERTMNATVEAYVAVNGASVKSTAAVEIKVTPVAPVIESAYYLIGTNNGWALDASTPFTHSGADVYDDPVFTVTIDAPVDAETGARVDMYFKVAPQSAIDNADWNVVYGCATDGDTSLEGNLVAGGSAGAMMQPATDGALYYQISVNMLEGTYTITPLSFGEFIWIPGDHQSWAPSTAPRLRSANSDGIYTGFCYLDGGFKFTQQPEWVNDKEYNSSHFPNMGSNLSAGDGGNIVIDQAGFYYLVADIPTGTLTATLIDSWGIVGDAAGSWDIDMPMAWDAAKGCWSTTAELAAGAIKFRANGGWDISVGGASFDDLTEANGDNLNVEAGTYLIELYLQRTDSEKMYATLTAE